MARKNTTARKRVKRPSAQKTGDKKWERLYQNLANTRAKLRPAYNKGVASTIAGVIDYFQYPQVKILVVGGGKGTFSRDLLPAVKMELKKLGREPRFQVIESDPLGVIRDAPGKRLRAKAEFLPFRAGEFDLVIGESMIHQTDMSVSIPEIKRVLNANGSFIHVADNVPIRGTVHPDLGDKPVTPIKSDSGLERIMPRVVDSHKRQLEKIRTQCHESGLSSAAIQFEGEVLTSAKRKMGVLGGVNLNKSNFIHSNMGVLQPRVVSDVPRGKRKLVYSGFITIASKYSRITSIVKHLQHL